MFDELTASPGTVVQVVIATVVVYLAFVLLLRVLGLRTLATMSLTDFACLMAVGALVGRTALLAEPSLVTGLVGLVTLLVTHRAVAALERRAGPGRWLRRAPVVLAADGRLFPDAMRAARVGDDELRQVLRLAGITSLEQLGRVVLERNGRISVLRADPSLDPWLTGDLDESGDRPERP